MGTNPGLNVWPIVVGNNLQLVAAGDALWKTGGATIDWATVPALTADKLLADGSTVLAGQKFLDLGTVLARITASGKYGPFSTLASDGRQTLTRDRAGLVNSAHRENSIIPGLPVPATNLIGLLIGGTVWRTRLKVTGLGTSPLADPTVAPTLTSVSTGSPGAGAWTLAYSYLTPTGETGLSPTAAVTVDSSHHPHVGAIAVPATASGINYYMSPAADTATGLLFAGTSATGAAQDFTAAPTGAAAPTYNSTGNQPTQASFEAAFPDIHYHEL